MNARTILARTSEAVGDPEADATFRILAPTRYQWTFNSPKHTRHRIERRDFVPLNYLRPNWDGVTVLNPWPPRSFDLVHAYNRIPLTRQPFIIGFESHMPRAQWLEKTAYFRWLARKLRSDQCLRIVAISRWAVKTFEALHEDGPLARDLRPKLTQRYPNVVIPDTTDEVDAAAETLRLVFVGNHFARKGGCSVLRFAETALERGWPVHVDIVSSLQWGNGIWTDPERRDFFDRYRPLLALPNVTHHGSQPNASVLRMLRQSHASLLPTLSDTFGYSVIESMVNHVPVIATRLQAIPEFVEDGESGLLLDLPCNATGDWEHTVSSDRDTPHFERHFEDAVQDLAGQLSARIERLLNDRSLLAGLRRGARARAEAQFVLRPASLWWDELYRSALAR